MAQRAQPVRSKATRVRATRVRPKRATRKTAVTAKRTTGKRTSKRKNPDPQTTALAPRTPVPLLRAKYDAAQTTSDNTRHWVNADSLSANAAMSNDVRNLLRQRARYEVANNSYAKGLVLTLANDCIGTGPRLQVQTRDRDFNRQVEAAFENWAAQVRLAAKLRTAKQAKTTDGESFGQLFANGGLPHPVKLDIALVDCDRVTSPYSPLAAAGTVDGMKLDEYGLPQQYFVMKNHPGEVLSGVEDYNTIDASYIFHWFRSDRPQQYRGVPELTPALPLYAQLRRYTLAVLAAAETAADFAAVLYTESPPDEGAVAAVDPMDTIDLEKRMATALPEGWKLAQIKAEQPATSYKEFKGEILNEIARCVNVPYNIAACNSSDYNYASGRLDHQTYFKSVLVERYDCQAVMLDPLLQAWVNEAMLMSEFAGLRRFGAGLPHQWFWDGFEHVDPVKNARAQQIRLKNGTTNLQIECAKDKMDWESVQDQRAIEVERAREKGLVQETDNGHT